MKTIAPLITAVSKPNSKPPIAATVAGSKGSGPSHLRLINISGRSSWTHSRKWWLERFPALINMAAYISSTLNSEQTLLVIPAPLLGNTTEAAVF
jgi:hypothetical protein